MPIQGSILPSLVAPFRFTQSVWLPNCDKMPAGLYTTYTIYYYWVAKQCEHSCASAVNVSPAFDQCDTMTGPIQPNASSGRAARMKKINKVKTFEPLRWRRAECNCRNRCSIDLFSSRFLGIFGARIWCRTITRIQFLLFNTDFD